MEEVELLCDRIIILDKGKIIACGTNKELIELVNIEEKVTVEIDNIKYNHLNEIESFKNVLDVNYKDNILYITYKKGKNNLKDLMDYMQENKIKYNKIFSELPTLNDVFLELTGKELRD